VHPTLIHGWKKLLLAGADALFANGSKPAAGDAEGQKAELFEQIGRLKIELEWVKKTTLANLGRVERRSPGIRLFSPGNAGIQPKNGEHFKFSPQVCQPRKKVGPVA
jgi:hypothetical protein